MTETKIDDGGLAYPGYRIEQVGTVADHGFSDDESPTYDDVRHPGMSLRDYFAGHFLAAASSSKDEVLDVENPSDDAAVEKALRKHWGYVAKAAYIAADAMIAARKVGVE